MDKSKFNILIVDDIPKNIQIIGNHLREEGFNLEFATSGKAALEWTSKEKFDLILLDIMMPEMSGFEVCTKLKSDEKYKYTPIIFLTAKDDSESITKSFSLGAQDYIIKPFKKSELLARVNTHIELQYHRYVLEDTNKLLEAKVEERTNELKIANEELIKLDEAKSDFLQMISHEIRTPLNGIMGASDLLKTQITKPEYFKLFHILDVSVKRLEKFTLDALQITSLKTKQYQLKRSNVNVVKFINQILIGLSNEIETNKTTITNDVPADLMMDIDINLFNDALQRIINNSIKHTALNGEVNIRAREEDKRLHIQVSDNGDGFNEEFIKKRITTFSTSKEFYNQNTGFDIAIVNLIVSYHQGSLNLANLSPNGASVTIQLPQSTISEKA